jgi:ubiquinone/menaquinone biosynthesis C-methylase UbiE
VSKIYDKYLTIDQQKGIKAIPDERRWNNYRNFDLELEVWDTFWNNTFKWTGEQKPRVLDYGCGAAYDEVVASKLGTAEVTSLDINTKEVKIVFGRFHKVTGVKATYWDGSTMPFDDNTFDAIISKASLSKLVKSSWDNALSELARVTKPAGVWYIAPHYMGDRLIENVPEAVKNQLTDKSISFCSWTWDTEDPRNRYWRNKGIETADAKGGHDFNYENRENIGVQADPEPKEDDE